MAELHIADVESAINYLTRRIPPGQNHSSRPELRALVDLYAQMVCRGDQTVSESHLTVDAQFGWLEWYETTPDTPCIAICSTSQGDESCKGCGRTFAEVQHWPGMSPVEKRNTWRRITVDAGSWRFNRYAERATK